MLQLFLFETGGIRKHDLGKNNQKFVLANHYNSVMLVLIPAGLTAPKAFGVAEVEGRSPVERAAATPYASWGDALLSDHRGAAPNRGHD